MMDDPQKEDYIQKRLNKILETRIETDRETLDALADLSQFYTENTLQSRRNLRSQIERRSLAINEVRFCLFCARSAYFLPFFIYVIQIRS